MNWQLVMNHSIFFTRS